MALCDHSYRFGPDKFVELVPRQRLALFAQSNPNYAAMVAVGRDLLVSLGVLDPAPSADGFSGGGGGESGGAGAGREI